MKKILSNFRIAGNSAKIQKQCGKAIFKSGPFAQNRPSHLGHRHADAIACGALSYPEMRLLFAVTDAFTVPGRGVVLLPELTFVGDEKFRVGESLRLRFIDGTEELVEIGGLEFLKTTKRKCLLVIMLRGKRKEDVPVGTEVWAIEKSAL